MPDDDGEPTSGEAENPSLVDTAMNAADLVTVKGLLLGGGPRFARDAFGPVLAFYDRMTSRDFDPGGLKRARAG